MKVLLLLLVSLAALAACHEGHDEAGHVCQHDALMEAELARDPQYLTRMRETAVPQVHDPEHMRAFARHHAAKTAIARAGHLNPTEARERLGGRAKTRGNLVGAASIRVTLNYDSFGTSDSRTCSTVGQVVNVGASGGPNCSALIQNDCKIVCTAQQVLSTTSSNFIKNKLLPDAVNYLNQALEVIPVSGNLQVSGFDDGTGNRVCGFSSKGYVPISNSLQTTGIPNTDLIIFVTARPTVGTLLAYAGACQMDATTARPVAGQLNIAPNAVYEKTSTAFDYETILGTVVHEITHILGFTISQFTMAYTGNFSAAQSGFVNPSDYSRLPAAQVIQQMNVGPSPYYPSQWGLITPILMQRAKSYYGNTPTDCSGLPAVPLENGGGAGTQYTHFDKRTMGDELMTGSIFNSPKFSELTLAVLEDSGWSNANYDVDLGFGVLTELYTYGRNKGVDAACSFVSARCSASNWADPSYFCTTAGAQACSVTRESYGTCAILTYTSNLDPSQQYLSLPNEGGYDALADYCPQLAPTKYCADPTNTIPGSDAASGMFYTAASACFASTTTAHNQTLPQGATSFCYPRGCVGSNMNINIGRIWAACPAGGQASSQDMSGVVTCPDQDYITRQCVTIIPTTGAPAAPALTTCTANNFTAAGGLLVTISGTGLASVVYADVAGVPCTITQTTSTSVVCTTGVYAGTTLGGTVPACNVVDSYNRMSTSSNMLNVPPSGGSGLTSGGPDSTGAGASSTTTSDTPTASTAGPSARQQGSAVVVTAFLAVTALFLSV